MRRFTQTQRGPANKRVTVTLLLLLALSLTLLLVPYQAFADGPARFILEKCDSELPGGSVEGIAYKGSSSFTPAENCSVPEGVVFIVQTSATSNSSAQWSVPLPPPPGGSVESITVTGQMCDGSYHDPGTLAFAVTATWPVTCAPETRTFIVNSTVPNPGLLFLGCSGTCEPNPFVWARYFAAIDADPSPPVVDELSGSLLAGPVARGADTLTARAHDEGGGVSKLWADVNGVEIGDPVLPPCQTYQVTNASVTGTVVTSPTPCPASAEASWTLDTEHFPFHDGSNSVQVCANDFATIGRPNTSCSQPSLVAVDNSCPASQQAEGWTLVAGFGKFNISQTVVEFGEGATIRGRLTNQSGRPVSGATICVGNSHIGSEAVSHQRPGARTNANGHFRVRIPPGPNREIALGYRHGNFQIERALKLDTKAGPTIALSKARVKDGGLIRISGSLPGPDRVGHVLVLQASSIHGHRWFTFRRVTTDRHGRYTGTYRFGRSPTAITYRIRAVVPRQAGYPYYSGASKPARVRVGDPQCSTACRRHSRRRAVTRNRDEASAPAASHRGRRRSPSFPTR